MSAKLHKLPINRADGYPLNHGKEWSIQDRIKLCNLYEQDSPRLTWYGIAREMGRTQNACQFQMRMLFVLASLLNVKELAAALGKTHKKIHKPGGYVTSVQNTQKGWR